MTRIAIIIDGTVSEIRDVDDRAVVSPNALAVVTDPLPAFASATHKVAPGKLLIVDGPPPFVRETWEVIERSAEERAEAEELEKDEADRQSLKAAFAVLDSGSATNAQVQRTLARIIRWIGRQKGIPQ